MILGLTGGFGCGKSTAARLFERLGFRYLDSDALVREHVYARPEVRAALQARFGPEACLPDGSINRVHIGAIVFANDAERLWLEDLTHPPLFAHWRDRLDSDPAGNWVIEVPLLFEKQLENWFDFTICVACSPTQQLARLEQRGMERALAERRISKQWPLGRKIELSHYVLLNDGSAEFLEQQVAHLVRELPAAS
jgi:dephospho-CoA kinase